MPIPLGPILQLGFFFFFKWLFQQLTEWAAVSSVKNLFDQVPLCMGKHVTLATSRQSCELAAPLHMIQRMSERQSAHKKAEKSRRGILSFTKTLLFVLKQSRCKQRLWTGS